MFQPGPSGSSGGAGDSNGASASQLDAASAMDTSLQSMSGADFDGHVTHTAQAAPITVQWLVENFEPAEGCSLRRSTLYNYYLHHCTEQRLEPVNPASFGKLIRSVFLGLRTRRLGTRGNSKYHYYGIRVKAASPLNQLSEDHTMAIRNHPLSLSPTGSPQSPQSSASASAAPGSSHSGSSGSAAKRLITSAANSAAAAASSGYYSAETAEYKPIVANMAAIGVDQHSAAVSQQPPPVMTVIVQPAQQNGGTGGPAKLAPQTTAIAAKTAALK